MAKKRFMRAVRKVWRLAWDCTTLVSQLHNERDKAPWEPKSRVESFDKDRWELYNMLEDFSQSRDLAAIHPEKLKDRRDTGDAGFHASGTSMAAA
jgi:arylsulfatase A-like enzyme